MQVYSTGPASGLAPHDSYRSSELMSQGDIISQNNDHLSTQAHELPLISPPTAPYFLGQSEPWSQTIQSNGGGQRPEYLTNLQSSTLPSSGFQPTAFQHPSTTHHAFMNVPRHVTYPGYSPYNAPVSEPTRTIPQARIDSSTRYSPSFGSPGSSGIRVQTVPVHFCNDHMSPQGPLPQTSGSWLNMRTPDFLPERTRDLSWDSQQRPLQVQSSLGQVPVNPMEIDLFGLIDQSQASFGANTRPQYGLNTFEGSELPSSSSNGTTMTNRSRGSLSHQTTQFSNTLYPSTLESPRSSSDFLSSQLDNFSNEHFLLREPVSNPPQLNSQLSNFERIFSPPPFQTPQSGPNNMSMSRCPSCVSHNLRDLDLN